MDEWISIAAAGAVLPILLFLIVILIKQNSIGREQAETSRILGLLMDMVEFQSESMQKRMEKEPEDSSAARPSLISYQKPKLPTEPKAQRPPPPPAKLKRW